MTNHINKNLYFANYFKDLRRKERLTLREFCKAAEADPGNISKMERGLVHPPYDRDILERYAKVLRIIEGSDEWYCFFDLAAADHGTLPQDLRSDQEITKILPTFFRTLRGQKPTKEELLKLAEKLRLE